MIGKVGDGRACKIKGVEAVSAGRYGGKQRCLIKQVYFSLTALTYVWDCGTPNTTEVLPGVDEI